MRPQLGDVSGMGAGALSGRDVRAHPRLGCVRGAARGASGVREWAAGGARSRGSGRVAPSPRRRRAVRVRTHRPWPGLIRRHGCAGLYANAQWVWGFFGRRDVGATGLEANAMLA